MQTLYKFVCYDSTDANMHAGVRHLGLQSNCSVQTLNPRYYFHLELVWDSVAVYTHSQMKDIMIANNDMRICEIVHNMTP